MKYVSRIRLFVYVVATTQVLGALGTQAADELARRSPHPYLTYSDANIARLKERVRNEPAIADAWAKMLADADRMVESTARRRGRGSSTELLCLAYRMTGERDLANASNSPSSRTNWVDAAVRCSFCVSHRGMRALTAARHASRLASPLTASTIC